MKLEQNEAPMIFSTTNIPDIFFAEYLSQSNSDYIKLYLYIIFLAKYNKDVKVNDLSKKLNLSLPIIQDGIKYWEELGLISKKTTGYGVTNIQEIELNKLYNAKLTSAPEDLAKNQKNIYRAKAIETINNSFFQGVMSPSWYSDIDMWFKKFEFDEQVMIALFRYCFDKSALHKNYVKAVADAWHNCKIKSFTDLDNYSQKQEKFSIIKKDIAKKLGINRNLSQYEEAYIEKWTVDFAYNLEIIEIALKRTTGKSNPTFDYLDKVISDWNDRNLKTSIEILEFLKTFKQKEKSKAEITKKYSYNNYEQRKYENFDGFYDNLPGGKDGEGNNK